jgi:predicted nucleic acid-binding protein
VIFLDTSFLYPLFNADDDDHARVREVFESLRGRRLNELRAARPSSVEG